MTGEPTTASPFGQRLRQWRAVRGMSQLDLATAAGTTPRHVSFVETGRSRPGRDLVLRLADVLAVPVRERNHLLAAAGLAPAHPTHELGTEAMRAVDRVLQRVLAAHEPYPAWVVGRGLTFLASNRAAEAIFPGLCALGPGEVIDLWLGPGPFREQVRNWQDVAWATVAALRREVAATADAQAQRLLRHAEALTRRLPGPAPDLHADLPVVCPVLELDGQVVRTITTVMRFDTAVEVTASELRVELMFPADESGDLLFRRLATARTDPAPTQD